MLISSDANFRKKCYDVIDERLNASKIIIFTSHETDVIKKVCNKILWLHKGAQMAFGKKEEILTAYTVKNG